MVKKYNRKKLNTAIAAACLSMTLLTPPVSTRVNAADINVSSTTGTINLNSGDNLTVTNSGVISGATNGVAIINEIPGTINNSGTIQGGYLGLGVFSNSDISGGINNSGTIQGNVLGILGMISSDISGGIDNSGTIQGSYLGIGVINNSDISGGINNSGTIQGDDFGIYILSSSDISGGIDNSGTIQGSLLLGIGAINNSDISGGINNSGTIQGNYIVIGVINSSDISGGINNSGTIQGSYVGIGILNGSNTSGGIDNSGTIQGSYLGIGVANSSDISGGINNSGTIQGGYVGIGVMSRSNISGGIINSGIIRGTAGPALALNDASGNGIVPNTKIVVDNSGLIDGAVTLNNNILNLTGTGGRVTGAVTGTAGSQVNVSGTFATENTFDVDAFNISQGGTLTAGHGITATGGVTNAGSMRIPSGGNTTITGDYTQNGTGVFQTGVTNYGKLAVTGTADFASGSTINVEVTSNDTLTPGDQMSDIITAGTLNASSLAVTDNSAMWGFLPIIDGQTLDLDVDQELTLLQAVQGSSTSSGAAGAAAALDALIASGTGGDMQMIINMLGTMGTAEELAQSVAQFTPVFTGSAANNTLATARQGGAAVAHQRNAGLSSGDPLLKDREIWIKPFYTYTDQDKRKNVYGYKADSTGIAVGADAEVSSLWRIGAALSYAKGNFEDRSPVTNDNLDIDTWQGTVYGSRQIMTDLQLNLVAALGLNKNESARKIAFGDLNRTAKADYDSWHAHLDAELEKRFKLGDKTTLTSALRTQYSYIDVEGYTETGASGLNLKVSSSDADALMASISGKLSHAFTESLLLSTHLGIGYDFLTEQSRLTSSFSGGGPVFTTIGLDPAPLFVRAGLAADFQTSRGFKITAQYDVEAREDYHNHVVALNLRIPLNFNK